MKPTGRCDQLTQNYEIPEKALKAIQKPAEPDRPEQHLETEDAVKGAAKTGDYGREFEERMELQATQKKIRPPSNQRWTQNDHYFEENPEYSDRSKPFSSPLQPNARRNSNNKQPTWETDADDFHERERETLGERPGQSHKTPTGYPSRAEMKSRHLRDTTPPRPDGRNEPQQQQFDPITSLPKPQRFAPTQQSSSKSQQGPRIAREAFSEHGQASEKR